MGSSANYMKLQFGRSATALGSDFRPSSFLKDEKKSSIGYTYGQTRAFMDELKSIVNQSDFKKYITTIDH
jgi:hypothetical protein